MTATARFHVALRIEKQSGEVVLRLFPQPGEWLGTWPKHIDLGVSSDFDATPGDIIELTWQRTGKTIYTKKGST